MLYPVSLLQVDHIAGVLFKALPVIGLEALLDLRLKLYGCFLGLPLRPLLPHSCRGRPGHIMAYLLPGAVPASGDGDLVADAGFAVNSLDVRHTPLLSCLLRKHLAKLNKAAVQNVDLRHALPVIDLMGKQRGILVQKHLYRLFLRADNPVLSNPGPLI